MKVIVKPAGVVLIGAVAIAGMAYAQFYSRDVAPPEAVAHTDGVATRTVGWKLGREGGADGALEEMRIDGGVGLRITTLALGRDPCNVSALLPLNRPLRATDTLNLSFRVRADRARTIALVLQRYTPSRPDFWKRSVAVDTAWRSFSFDVQAVPCEAWEPWLAVYAGDALGSLEVADFTLLRR